MTNEVKNVKTNVEQIKNGEYLAMISYVKVLRHAHRNVYGKIEKSIDVKDCMNGGEYTATYPVIENQFINATQYTEEIPVTMTQLIRIFQAIGSEIFTIKFYKEAKDSEINKSIDNSFELIEGVCFKYIHALTSEPDASKRDKMATSLGKELKETKKHAKKEIKDAITGELRTMVAHKVAFNLKSLDELENTSFSLSDGKFTVVDLEAEIDKNLSYDNRIKHFIARNLQEIIVGGKRYYKK